MNRFSFPVFALLALSAPVAAQDPIDVRTNAPAGTTVWFVELDKNTNTIDMGGQAMETGQTINRTFCLTVKSVGEDGTRVVELEVARVHGAMNVPMMGDMAFDSEKASDDEDDMMGGMGMGQVTAQLTALAGNKFLAKVDANGKVVGDAQPAGDKDAMEKAKDHVSEAKQLVESAFGKRPEKAIAVGEKWKFDDADGSGRMPMKADLEGTLVEATDAHFTMKFAGTMKKGDSPELGDSEEEQMAAEMLEGMTLENGKMSGEQKLSRTDGLVVSSTANVTADISMESPMGAMEMALKATKSLSRTDAPKKKAAPKEAPKKDAETGN